RLDCAIPERLVIAVMRLNMIDGICWPNQSLSEAVLAKRLLHELIASASTPASVVIGSASPVAALTAAFAVETGEGIGTHGMDADTDPESAKDHHEQPFWRRPRSSCPLSSGKSRFLIRIQNYSFCVLSCLTFLRNLDFLRTEDILI